MALSHGLVIINAAIVGLCVGSFLNVVIWRVPQGLSVRTPGSHCPGCERPLTWGQNVPIVSWLVLRGRCASCTASISFRYPLVEASTAALFVAIAGSRPGWEIVPFCGCGAGMLALSLIDLDCYRLPDRVLGPTVAITGGGFALAALCDGQPGALVRSLAGAAIGLAVLGAIHLVQPKGMGFGDVKLAALCGLILGWRGFGFVAVGLFGAFFLGAAVGGALLATGVLKRRAKIPFGPFLCVASFGVALYGAPLVTVLGRIYGR